MNENEGSTAVMERPPEPDPSTRRFKETVQMQRELKADSRPGKESDLQRQLDELVDSPDFKVDSEHPPLPEVVLKKEKDWSGYGWNEEDKKRIKNRLKYVLNLSQLPEEELNKVLETALENILAIDRTPAEVDTLLSPEVIAKVKGIEDTSSANENLQLNSREERALVLKTIGIQEELVYRAILPHEFHDEVKEKALKIPGDLIDVAWKIIESNPDEFGVNGKYPVLQMQIGVKKDGQGNIIYKKDQDGEILKDQKGNSIPEIEGRYCVNEANFMLFIRSRINDIYSNEPDQANNFFGDIQFSHSFGSLNIGTMFLDNPKYFSDETGVKYESLYNQALMEVWMMTTIRKYDVEYKAVMDDGKELLKALAGLFKYNTLTKNVAGKSLFYYMSTLSQHFNDGNNDSKLGQAWNKVFLAYFNLSDYEELQKVLGEDSKFFTKTGMMKAIKEVYGKKVGATKMPNLTPFLGEKEQAFQDAFGDGEHVKDKDAFIKFINYFGEFKPSGDHIKVVEVALQNTIDEEKKDLKGDGTGEKDLEQNGKLDDHSKGVASLIAKSLIRVFGAGTKNDTGMTAFDKQVETQYTEGYRRKMASTKRGGSAGNPFTVPMFHGLSMEFLRGTRVGTAITEYQYVDSNGKTKTGTRTKTVHEVMMAMQDVSQEYKALRAEAKKAGDEKRVADLDIEEQQKFKLIAGQLEFQENALLNWVANHQARARQVYDQVSQAEQIDFEKFTKYDSLLRGVSFDRMGFQAAVNDKLLKPLRYLFETYGELNMNMETRVLKFKGREKGPGGKEKDKWEWEDGYLGESLFGHQILDIPQFRKLASQYDEKDKDKRHKRVGKYIKDEDGNFVIDYDKVQADQTLVWKQWALMKIGADLWGHISNHSTDPAYGLAYYIDVLEAIESIPGEVTGDDKDMRGVRVTTPFFSHEQIKWLRKISSTTNFKLYARAIATDIFTGKHRKEGLFDDSASIFIGAIFRGY